MTKYGVHSNSESLFYYTCTAKPRADCEKLRSSTRQEHGRGTCPRKRFPANELKGKPRVPVIKRPTFGSMAAPIAIEL
jgi:hypothetical protein